MKVAVSSDAYKIFGQSCDMLFQNRIHGKTTEWLEIETGLMFSLYFDYNGWMMISHFIFFSILYITLFYFIEYNIIHFQQLNIYFFQIESLHNFSIPYIH